MKLTNDFSELIAQRKRMGAQLSDWKIGTVELDIRESLLVDLRQGIEINLDDVEVGPGKLLTYRGEQVILYIKDTQSSLWTLENEPEKSRRFHIAECRTLDSMREAKRFERYVVTNRTDGNFLVDWLDPLTRKRGETEAALKVCKNCLMVLNYRGYEKYNSRMMLPDESLQPKSEIWSNFSIIEFLMDYATFFRSRPDRQDKLAPLNDYVVNWPQISEKCRRAVKWRCEECRVDLSDCRGSLHCHHKSGVVTDNSIANLSVLCALCHARQPAHNHMKIPSSERSMINRLRIMQGIAPA